MNARPTPAEISLAICKALAKDRQENPMGGPDAFIPTRTFGIIDAAITQACDVREGAK